MMKNENLLALRRELIRISRAIRKELARPRPDLVKVIGLRRQESACAERLTKAIAALRSHQRSGPAQLRGAPALQGAVQ